MMARSEFSDKTKLQAYKLSCGKCKLCKGHLYVGKFHYDHRVPDAQGGDNSLDNCDVLCVNCHDKKTRVDNSATAKCKRVERKHLGIKTTTKPMPCGRNSKFKRKMNGQIVPRD